MKSLKYLLLFSLCFVACKSAKYKSLDEGIYADILTNKGTILLALYAEDVPMTVANFVSLAEGTNPKMIDSLKGTPYFDGIRFHRVIPNFMIQGGDPTGTGRGNAGYRFADEFTDLMHDKPGILSMANSGPATNGSQFFITHVPTPWLDGKHTVFGHVVEGMDVVNSIQKGDTLENVRIERIGDNANEFIANEGSFNDLLAQANEGIIAQQALRQVDFEDFATSTYPDATKNDLGYFTRINKEGDGNLANQGQLVSVDIALKANSGQIMRAPGSAIDFTLGSGEIIRIIEENTQAMSIGEERTIIATYEYVFGDAPSGNIPQDSFIIFELILISAMDK